MRAAKLLSVGATLLLFCQGVGAEVLDSEDFESFAPVPFDISTAANWTVAAGQEPNIAVVNSSLSYSNGVIHIDGGNQALQVGPGLPAATTNNLVDWSLSPISAGDVWFSFLLQSSENGSSSLPDVADSRDFFQIFFSEAGAEGQSLSLVVDNDRGGPPGSDHNFRARAGSSGQNTTGFTDATGAVLNQPLQSFFVVGHIEKVGDEYETVCVPRREDWPRAEGRL